MMQDETGFAERGDTGGRSQQIKQARADHNVCPLVGRIAQSEKIGDASLIKP
jgi:hypothetical protein